MVSRTWKPSISGITRSRKRVEIFSSCKRSFIAPLPWSESNISCSSSLMYERTNLCIIGASSIMAILLNFFVLVSVYCGIRIHRKSGALFAVCFTLLSDRQVRCHLRSSSLF